MKKFIVEVNDTIRPETVEFDTREEAEKFAKKAEGWVIDYPFGSVEIIEVDEEE